MFMVEVAGMRCLYTGDYSRIADRHMPAAGTFCDWCVVWVGDWRVGE
jgi:Cft2 family RNA processing exonuclease